MCPHLPAAAAFNRPPPAPRQVLDSVYLARATIPAGLHESGVAAARSRALPQNAMGKGRTRSPWRFRQYARASVACESLPGIRRSPSMVVQGSSLRAEGGGRLTRGSSRRGPVRWQVTVNSRAVRPACGGPRRLSRSVGPTVSFLGPKRNDSRIISF
jgi:hypothetical protein